jgi:hypothetical protein
MDYRIYRVPWRVSADPVVSPSEHLYSNKGTPMSHSELSYIIRLPVVSFTSSEYSHFDIHIPSYTIIDGYSVARRSMCTFTLSQNHNDISPSPTYTEAFDLVIFWICHSARKVNLLPSLLVKAFQIL